MFHRSPRTVLFVDDDVDHLESARLLLHHAYQIYTARTATEGLALAAARNPDVVIMDIRLPDFSGSDAAVKLQQTQPVALVFLTGLADDETIQRAKIAQPYGFLIKPYSETELRVAIELAYARHTSHRELELSHARLDSLVRERTAALEVQIKQFKALEREIEALRTLHAVHDNQISTTANAISRLDTVIQVLGRFVDRLRNDEPAQAN